MRRLQQLLEYRWIRYENFFPEHIQMTSLLRAVNNRLP